MLRFSGIIGLFSMWFCFNSCIYHERPQTDYGALDILADQEKKNIIHVIYKREATHFSNDLRNGGGLKNVTYTYYVVHYQLPEGEPARTRMYRWFSESDKYLFYPQEDSLLRVLLRSGPALKGFRPFNALSQYKKYECHSFERCRYQLDFVVKDSLYHWLGDSLVKSGYYTIKEINRNAFFGAIDVKNDTLYKFKMDHTYDAPSKFVLPKGLSYYKFSVTSNPTYIALKNKKADSLFLYVVNPAAERPGRLINTKNISALPAKMGEHSSELLVRNGEIELAVMKTNYRTQYSGDVISDFYYYGKRLKHYRIPEDSVFMALVKTK